MGKSKARILRKGKNDQLPKITRDDALTIVVKALKDADLSTAKNYITLFSLTGEELLEAGAGYESVIAIKNLFG